LVNTSGTLGSLVFDPASQTLRYVADHDSFDALAPGQTAVDRFAYTVTDENGLTSTATVEVTVTGVADGVQRSGRNGDDTLNGTAGEDKLTGNNGDDVLFGLEGHDRLDGGNGADKLFGGNGQDILAGGSGDDLLSGGLGADVFVFGRNGGADMVIDFDTLLDAISLHDGIAVKGHTTGDFNGDGVTDLSIAFTGAGGSVTLLGVGDFSAIKIGGPELVTDHPII
jgi:Ca2+-binding RTX toxin-like protein